MAPARVWQLAQVLDTTGIVVAGIRDHQWAAPTPCSDWNVHALLNHLVVGNHLFAALLREQTTLEEARGLPPTDLLGDRPLDAYRDSAAATRYHPDTALINYYDEAARMGMHQDKDERADEPVVSLSIGDAAVFRLGNTVNRAKPYADVQLTSGDLFVFGGPSRFAFHGVPKVHPGTTPADCGLATGRLNITMRVTGMP